MDLVLQFYIKFFPSLTCELVLAADVCLSYNRVDYANIMDIMEPNLAIPMKAMTIM